MQIMKKLPGLSILPKPQYIRFSSGSLKSSTIKNIRVGGKISPTLRKHVRSFANRNHIALTQEKDESILVTINSSNEAFTHPEGYQISITDTIILKGFDEVGLYYGLNTLQQIFDTNKSIPKCTIEDWPVLPIRGFYFDLTRQVPTVDFLKSIVDRAAAVKLNVLMIQYREYFPYDGFPFIVSAKSYTANDIVDFVQYANERYIQIIPLLQSISFQEHILRASAYNYLREIPTKISGICPSHPDSFQLYCSLAEQLIKAHPNSKYFHCGVDEANKVGLCPRCKSEDKSKAELVANYANKIISYLLEQGIKPLMWADMLFGHFENRQTVSHYTADMFTKLSREVVAVDWDYWSTSLSSPPVELSPYPGYAGFSHLDRLLDAGFSVIGAPSNSHVDNTDLNEIDHMLAFENISAYAHELKKRKCLGMINTFWPTDANGTPWLHFLHSRTMETDVEVVDVLYTQIRPGLEAHWYTIWRSAECAWSDDPHNKSDYDRVFSHLFTGTSNTLYADALSLASFPIDSPKRPLENPIDENTTQQRLIEAIDLLKKSAKKAVKGKNTITYSELYIRIQKHQSQWKSFLGALPHFHASGLSHEEKVELDQLIRERKRLEKDFEEVYQKIYKDVDLQEEIQIRFEEEGRLQDQLLWAEERLKLSNS
jgi:hypothetical protein